MSCVSPIVFIEFPVLNSPSGVAAKPAHLGKRWLEPKGRTPDWRVTRSVYNFQILSYVLKAKFCREFTVQLPFTSKSGSKSSSFHTSTVETNNRVSGSKQMTVFVKWTSCL